MSEIARELKMLFYLNEKFNKNEVASIRELSELLEISSRQVRRYRDDLEQAGFSIDSKAGVNGGYKLVNPLDSSLAIPDNLLLALNVSLKNNVSLLKTLNTLPIVSSKLVPQIQGDYFISNETLDKETFIVDMIQKQKKISFMYEEKENKAYRLVVEPYRLLFTNRGYYLKANYLGKQKGLRIYSIDKMSDIKEEESFRLDLSLLEEIDNELKYYGIMQTDIPKVLKLKYKDKTDEHLISKYFENKVKFEKNKVCTIETIDIYECFYPIFSLGKRVEIIDKSIKEEYKKFLQNVLKELRQVK